MSHNSSFDIRDIGIALYEQAFRVYFYRNFSLPGRHSRDGNGKTVIVLVDGRRLPFGFLKNKVRYGLADQLRNILSVYFFCKEHDLDFRINWRSPFSLSNYLMPNIYDWSIQPERVSQNFFTVKTLLLSSRGYIHDADDINRDRHIRKLEQAVRKLKGGSQLHVYGNAYFAKRDFSALFHELFKPSVTLAEAVRFHTEKIGGPYESCVLRFQNLLGDFEEAGVAPLASAQAKCLMKRCGDRIERLWRDGFFSTDRILVTSDSNRFLEYVTRRCSFVYAVTGERRHSAFNECGTEDIWMRSFVDLLMLTGSEKISSLVTDTMYESGFPYFASLIGQRTFNLEKW